MSYLLALTLLFAPTYQIKLNLFGLPSNLFMLWIFFVWIIFAIYLITKNQISVFISGAKNINYKILYLMGLFFVAGIISLFVGGIKQKTLGEFLVIFVQPISLYFITRFIFEKHPNTKYQIINTLYIALGAAGFYAILQYFFSFHLPLLFQGNDFEPRRSVSFFSHPNFYALWAAPLLAFLFPDLKSKIENVGKNWMFGTAWIIGVIGLTLSFSRAGWLGLGAAAIIYVIFSGEKKIWRAAGWIVTAMFVLVVLMPSIRHRLTSPFYGEKSSSSRITLWQSGVKAIKQSPVFGLGLGGYSKEYRKLITDQTLPDHNFPHNIFLDLWVETGIIGLIGLIGLIASGIHEGLRNKKDLFKSSVALFLIALLVQGQIDNPYFNNDLAAIFWIVLAVL